MPTATRPRRRPVREVVDPVIVDEQAQPIAAPKTGELQLFNPFEDRVLFMDALNMISDEEWQKYWLYLYRLDPKVKNEEDRAFISRYQCAMDEDEIKEQHGGGKYMFWLKENIAEDSRSKNAGRSRKFKFSIAGTPKLQAGQVLLTPGGQVIQGNTPPVADPRPDSNGNDALAHVLSELVSLIKQQRGGDDQGMKLMGEAYKTSLTVVSEAARQTATSTTGSTLGDKLFEMLLPALINKPAAEKDPIREALLKSALARLENPQPVAPADGGMGQLTFLKDLFGVESIKDLIMPGAGPGDAWKSKLVEAGAGLVANLPMIIQAVMAGQERAFQRELQMAAFRERQAAIAAGRAPGELPAIPGQPAPVATVIPHIHAQTQPVPGEPPAEIEPMDPATVTQQALIDITQAFVAGLHGEAAASFIMAKYPQFAAVYAPLLADRAQVLAFAQNTEPLKQVAGEEGFSDFLDEFCKGMLSPESMDEESNDGSSPATA